MTLQIGRVGIDATLDAVRMRIGNDGVLRIIGEVSASEAEAKYLRDELWRMLDPGVLFVPISFTPDSSVNGYYELLSARVSMEAAASLGGWYPYDVAARKLGSDGRVLIESVMSGGVLANDNGISSPDYIHGVPGASYGYDPGSTIPSLLTRTGADGAVKVWRGINVSVNPRWGVAAGSFYSGAARIEFGTTLRLAAGLYAENLPNNWRLSNSLVRVTPNGTNGRIDVQHHDGTQWETVKTYQVLDGGAEVGQWDAVSVLTNDPGACALRLQRDVSGGGVITLDIRLRRGSRFAEFFITKGTSATFKVQRSTAEAATSITGGISASSNDADGNQYVIGSSKTVTKDTTQGGLEKANVTSWDFFIGSAIGGTGAVAGDAPSDLVNQYHGYVNEVMIPVLR